jgi:hypothetical protein
MSHGTDPGLGEEQHPTPEGDPQGGLLDRLATHVTEWSRRYVRMRLDALDPDR